MFLSLDFKGLRIEPSGHNDPICCFYRFRKNLVSQFGAGMVLDDKAIFLESLSVCIKAEFELQPENLELIEGILVDTNQLKKIVPDLTSPHAGKGREDV